MKKFTSLLIGLSLALAGAAFAQTTEETPGPGKTQGTTEKAGKTRVEKTAKPEATAKTTGAATETGVTGAEQGTGKGKGRAKAECSVAARGTETGDNAGATSDTVARNERDKSQVKTGRCAAAA